MFFRRFMLVGLVLCLTIAAVACQVTGPTEGSSYLTQSEPCQACQGVLVECASSSQTELQFVGCRDQWQQCQVDAQLGPKECSNPNDEDACALCRARHRGCEKNGNPDCAQQFGVCKAFLITRADIANSCTETEDISSDAACTVCRKDFVGCASDASGSNSAALCQGKFDNCLVANTVPNSSCMLPSGSEGCSLCQERFASCQAAAGTNCSNDFIACTGTVSANVTCGFPDQGAGGGAAGSGGSSEGGSDGGGGKGSTSSGMGGGPANLCAHSECNEGDMLEADCSACAQLVCQKDSYCCETAWDSMCTDEAKNSCDHCS